MSSHRPTLAIPWVEPLATTCIITTVSIFAIAWVSMVALALRFFHGSPIHSYVSVSVCWICACIPFGFGLLLSTSPINLAKRERTLHFDASRIAHNLPSTIIDGCGFAHSCTSNNVTHSHPLVAKLPSMAPSVLVHFLPQFATSTQMCSKWPSRHQPNHEWPCQQRQVIQLCGTLEPVCLSATMQQTSKEP